MVYGTGSGIPDTWRVQGWDNKLKPVRKKTPFKSKNKYLIIWHANRLPTQVEANYARLDHAIRSYNILKESLTLSSKSHYARITSLIGVKQKLNQDNEFNVFKNWLKWWSRWTINTTWTILNQPQGKNCKLKILQITECGISFFSCKKFICK